jgi:hypothetical protein
MRCKCEEAIQPRAGIGKNLRLALGFCVLFNVTACTDGEWRAGEWNDMENMCRGSAYCSAPCQGGQSESQGGCVEAP